MGCVHVYTGDGKGKTTAALGLLLRASGAGLCCLLYQFLKCGEYSEIKSLRARFPEVPIGQFGDGRFISPGSIPPEAIAQAQAGYQLAYGASCGGGYDLILLDEINIAADLGLIACDDILRLISDRSDRTELVLTGRNAPAVLVEAADLCTEMRMVKHYYQKGVGARRGIES